MQARSAMNNRKSILLIYLVLLALVVACYMGLERTFYQQDEWSVIGHVFVEDVYSNIIARQSIWQLLFAQGRVLPGLIYSGLYSLFPFQMLPIAILSYGFHALNALLVFLLTYQLSQKRVIAVVAACFFAINGVAQQAVSWGAASLSTLPAVTLILLAMLWYDNFLKTGKRQWFYGAFIATFSSLLFKEIGVFLIVLLPLIYFVREKSDGVLGKIISTVRMNVLFLVYGLAIIVFRIAGLFLASSEKVGQIVSGGAGFQEKVLVNLILYPATGLFQTFWPPEGIYTFAEKILAIHYPFTLSYPHPIFLAQTLLTDLLSLFGSSLIVLAILLLYFRTRERLPLLLLVAFVVIFTSFIPYAVLERSGSYLDSRYYYVATVGAGMLLGYLTYYLWQKNIFVKGLAIIGLLWLSTVHIASIRKAVNFQVAAAVDRKAVLTQLNQLHPTLDETTVFYVTGNQDYYVPLHRVPMQQGMGYTLLAWYYPASQRYADLLKEDFLWDIGSQGFKRSTTGGGFGYFADLESLKSTVLQQGISSNSVIGLSWDGSARKLTDISTETRAALNR